MNFSRMLDNLYPRRELPQDSQKRYLGPPDDEAGSAGGKASRKPKDMSARHNPCPKPLSDSENKKNRADMGIGELKKELQQEAIKRGEKEAWKDVISKGGWNGIKKEHIAKVLEVFARWDEEDRTAAETNVPAVQAEAPAPAAPQPPPGQKQDLMSAMKGHQSLAEVGSLPSLDSIIAEVGSLPSLDSMIKHLL